MVCPDTVYGLILSIVQYVWNGKVKVKVIVSYERYVLKLHLTISKAMKIIKKYTKLFTFY